LVGALLVPSYARPCAFHHRGTEDCPEEAQKVRPYSVLLRASVVKTEPERLRRPT